MRICASLSRQQFQILVLGLILLGFFFSFDSLTVSRLPEDGVAEDGIGDVIRAVWGIARGLTHNLPSGDAAEDFSAPLSETSELVELAGFVVQVGAEAQELHADQKSAGYLSCQLALHQTQTESGGLAVWPGSGLQREPGLQECQQAEIYTFMKADTASGQVQSVNDVSTTGLGAAEVAPIAAGSVVCYAGTVWHRGMGHTGVRTGNPRRALYFTVRNPEVDVNGQTREHSSLGDLALYVTRLPIV
eukprot:SAG31_NODE_1319_length_8817_cov_1.857077_6_plen_246_part_00